MTPAEDYGKPPRYAYIALGVGVLSVSTGAIFVRYAQQEAASLTIAAYRMAIAFVVVLVPTSIIHRRELRSLTSAGSLVTPPTTGRCASSVLP